MQTYFEMNYVDLSRWTKTLPNASKSCFVTFGLNLSYFASAPGHGSIWAGIPSDLEDKVRKAFDTPCCVSLGAHNAWFVLWPDGNFAWKFHGNYSALNKILTEAAPGSISVSNADHFKGCSADRTSVRRHLAVQQAPLLRCDAGSIHQIRLHRSSGRVDETYDGSLRCLGG
jgi:hypothetical protein